MTFFCSDIMKTISSFYFFLVVIFNVFIYIVIVIRIFNKCIMVTIVFITRIFSLFTWILYVKKLSINITKFLKWLDSVMQLFVFFPFHQQGWSGLSIALFYPVISLKVTILQIQNLSLKFKYFFIHFKYRCHL